LFFVKFYETKTGKVLVSEEKIRKADLVLEDKFNQANLFFKNYFQSFNLSKEIFGYSKKSYFEIRNKIALRILKILKVSDEMKLKKEKGSVSLFLKRIKE